MDPPVRITDRRGYVPDIACFREQNARPAAGEHWLTALPDLAVEVLSESTRRFDLVRTRRDYAAVGVRELWLIDPDGADGEEGPTAFVLRLPTTPTDPPEFGVSGGSGRPMSDMRAGAGCGGPGPRRCPG